MDPTRLPISSASESRDRPSDGFFSRRSFVQRFAAAGGIGLLTFKLGGCDKKLTPAEAKAQGASYRTLTPAEVRTLDALGEILLPGSAAAGLSHYIDHQLSGPPEMSMLMLRYLGVSPPFTSFYRNGLAGTDAAARKRYASHPAELDAKNGRAFASAMASGDLLEWSGPPAPLFFFALRNDAIDVMYSTTAGFERLGVPYMAHIPPASRWGE